MLLYTSCRAQEHWGCGGEKSMWLADILNLLVRSEELDKEERKEIREGLTALSRSELDSVEEEQEMVILFDHLVQNGRRWCRNNMYKFGHMLCWDMFSKA